MEKRKDLLVWIDLETTGFDNDFKMLGATKHKILEIGLHITDSEYNIVDDQGLQIIVHQDEQEMNKVMNPFVKDMHTKNGLLEKVQSSTISLQDADKKIMDYLNSYNIEPKSSPICGNNVSFDKNFIDAQLPQLSNFLHYRKIDVSSLAEIAKRTFPDIANQVKKPYKHRGVEDIEESIKEFKFYMNNIFKPISPVIENNQEKVRRKISPK